MDQHAILSALKRASIRKVEVAGIEVHVRGLTGKERLELVRRQAAAKSDETQKLTDAELCFWAMCTPDGERLYQSADALAETDGKALETIALAILEASGLTAAAQERAEGESAASPS